MATDAVRRVRWMFSAIIRNYNEVTTTPGDPARLPLCQGHGCPDGTFGVGDVVGLRVTVASP